MSAHLSLFTRISSPSLVSLQVDFVYTLFYQIPIVISCAISPSNIINLHLIRLQFKGEIDPGSRDFWNKEINRKIGRETKKVSLEVEEEKVKRMKLGFIRCI